MSAVRTAVAGAALAAVAALLGAPTATAHDGPHAPEPTADRAEVAKVLATIRRATAPFHDVQAAEDAGYAPAGHCVSLPDGSAAMGVHYVRGDLVDAVVDPSAPEVLVYAPGNDGALRLVAAEFLAVGPRPSLLGMDFEDGPFPGSSTLHAWVWQPNPAGTFAAFNPRVSC